MDFSALNIWELRKRCVSLNLPTSGNKDELVKLLQVVQMPYVAQLRDENASLQALVRHLSDQIERLTSSGKETEAETANSVSVGVKTTENELVSCNLESPTCPDIKEEDIPDFNDGFVPVKRKRHRKPRGPRKVVLLGDSHARGLAGLMQKSLGSDYQVSSVCRPGAPIGSVLHDTKTWTDGLSQRDHVLVIGGTNEGDKVSAELPSVVRKLKGMAATQVMMTEILVRYDTSKFEAMRKEANVRIRTAINAIGHCTIVDPNVALCRKMYTNHGLHLNAFGKAVISQFLATSILKKDRR